LRQKFVFSALRGHITSIVRTQQTPDNGKTRLRNINVPSYPLNFGEAQDCLETLKKVVLAAEEAAGLTH